MHYELGYVIVSRQLSMTWVCHSETSMFRKWTRKSDSYVLNTNYLQNTHQRLTGTTVALVTNVIHFTCQWF